MTELDDPVRLVKKGNPLAQRPVLAVGVLCGVLLVGAIAMGREGAREANQDEADEVSDVTLAPADKAAEEAIRGLQDRERALYEQPLTGPELSGSDDFPVEPYLSPRSEVDPSRAEEALRQALTSSSKIEMQHRERIDDLAQSVEPHFGEESSHLGGGLRSAELEALQQLAGGRDQPKYAQKANFIRHGAEDWPSGYLEKTRQGPLTRYELKSRGGDSCGHDFRNQLGSSGADSRAGRRGRLRHGHGPLSRHPAGKQARRHVRQRGRLRAEARARDLDEDYLPGCVAARARGHAGRRPGWLRRLQGQGQSPRGPPHRRGPPPHRLQPRR